MTNSEMLTKFSQTLETSMLNKSLVKLSLGNYQGNDKDLKNIYVKLVKIKRVDMFSFNYRYKTRDIFKNHEPGDGVKLILNFLSNDFKIGTLFTVDKETIIEHDKKGLIKIRERLLKSKLEPKLTHDKEKKRIIKPINNAYLHALKITDADGNVFKNAQDKYKQINQYIEILSSLIKELPSGTIKNVVDMGSGKGYLTFALYDYLKNNVGITPDVVGVEFRQDLVDLCNSVAKEAEFETLKFQQGTIEAYEGDNIDMLIALHACDTATDDAIFSGIKANAAIIVVAPCCHKQIRRAMEKNKVANDVSFLTKHGIFMERQAEMVTDGLRALLLEYAGYKTKVFEFISDAHTPKNVLVVGVKSKEQGGENKDKRAKNKNEGGKSKDQGARNKEEILQKIKATKAYFGIDYHHLERLLKL